ncbi:hypothetical protein [Asaia platycodi]|uniref:hypothetical protein n=1 Tax=Asaia platycodi TaxID=610243 RepID=UPI000B340685|nr:hypothetical protein [Asaia platycodi]
MGSEACFKGTSCGGSDRFSTHADTRQAGRQRLLESRADMAVGHIPESWHLE